MSMEEWAQSFTHSYLKVVIAIVLASDSLVKQSINKWKMKASNVRSISKEAFRKQACVYSTGVHLSDVMI
jgi:hypothetical protein